MEITLTTTPGLQFDEISIFWHWFPKRTNSFVISPLYFLIFGCPYFVYRFKQYYWVWRPPFWFLIAKQGNIGFGIQNVLRQKWAISQLRDFPVFSVGYSHHPPALMHNLVFELEYKSLIDLHSCFFLQIHHEQFTCSVFTFVQYSLRYFCHNNFAFIWYLSRFLS